MLADRAAGLSIEEIARRQGVTAVYVEMLIADPEGERSRQRNRQAQPDAFACELCGARLAMMGCHLRFIHGMDVREYRERFPGAPTVSPNHSAIKRDQLADQRDRPGEDRYWTERRIITAIRRWAVQHGRAPTKAEWWRPTGAGAEGGWALGKRPSVWIVTQRFGSWNVAIEASGFEPRGRGMQPGFRKKKCRHGHPLVGPKAEVRVRKDGYRDCRVCMRRRQREYDQRRKARGA